MNDFLAKYIDNNRGKLLDFVSRLVSTPSMNPPGDEKAVGLMISDELSRLGVLNVEVVGQVPERPNIIARIPGSGSGRVLMLNGHMDTKPVGDRSKWNSDPLVARIGTDGYLYGLGAADMKGAVAAMCYAAGAIASAPLRLEGDLVLAFTADEEAGSRYGSQYLVENNLIEADACLIGEPCGLRSEWQYLVLAARGICAWRTRVRGTQLHASISDIVPCVNASTKMAQVMVQMADRLRFRCPPHPYVPKGPTVNIGMRVESGIFYGVLPGLAEFTSDVRVHTGMRFESVREDLEGFVRDMMKKDPELNIEVEFEPDPLRWIEPTEISPEADIVLATQWAAERILGRAPAFGICPGWTDSRWFQGGAGIPTIPAFGPGLLSVCHSPNERVPLEGIVEAAKIYALTATRFLA